MPVSVQLKRVGFRVAYRLLQLIWFVRRPYTRGVKCLITSPEGVLLVRHTYGRRSWDLPGGALKRDEEPLACARREMEEELGMRDADWSAAGTIQGRQNHRRDLIYCFRTELAQAEVSPNPVELATVGWFPSGSLPAELSPYARPILEGVLIPTR
jgi:8-oxo-dGTP pyrophosphatase MutT (NUDIX family)